jgi:uncharacterized protein (TIGR02996 family)
MTADERSLIQAIIANPDDDLPRLVYADWLEEHGRGLRAEYIRVECEMASLPMGLPDTRKREKFLEDWVFALDGNIVMAWQREAKAAVPRHPQLCFFFDRGMPAELVCTVNYFVEHGAAVFQEHPITAVRFYSLQPKHVRHLAECSTSAKVQSMRLTEKVNEGTVRALLTDWPFPNATTLRFSASIIDMTTRRWHDQWAERSRMIAESGLPGQVRRLDLTGCGIGNEGGEALAGSPRLRKLELLDLRDNPLDRATIGALRKRFGNRVLFTERDLTGKSGRDLW